MTKGSGGAGDMVGMGMGFAMADKLAKNFGEPKTYAPEPYEKMYYYAKDKKPQGPFTIDEVEAFVRDKTVDSSTLMWGTGMEKWEKANQIDEIESLFNLLSPPPL
jgi:hypothetical protein